MRDIKFRVWDETTKTFLNQQTIHEFGVDFEFMNEGFILKSNGLSIGYIFEQFTGFKDKNNKEIYQGDILKPWSFLDKISVVKWEENPLETCGCGGDGFYCGFNLMNEETNKSEVVGNIHENPELLKCQHPIPERGPAQCKDGHWLGSSEHPVN
jgi:hypothetical protein